MMAAMRTPSRLSCHLSSWLGAWPPDGPNSMKITSSPTRVLPGWDGKVRPVAGLSTPDGAVLSVPEQYVEAVRSLGSTLDQIGPLLGETVGEPASRLFTGVFRWSDKPTRFDRPGRWLPTNHDDVADWLKPFNSAVLVGFAGESPAAGVGRKIHDRWGHELAVVTEPDHRGDGWAKRLVSQAAERVLDDGAIPTYLHAPSNEGSARTADAAGFPDRGWKVLGLMVEEPG